MGFLDQWPFKSREQQKQEREARERLYFPLGEGHREKLIELLAPLIKMKASREEKLFFYLCAKEVYAKSEGGEEAVLKACAKLRELRLKEDDRRVVVALLRLESRAGGLADFPTPEAVRVQALLEDEA